MNLNKLVKRSKGNEIFPLSFSDEENWRDILVTQKRGFFPKQFLFSLIYSLVHFFLSIGYEESICDAVVSRSSLRISNYCWPSWKQFQMSIPAVLPSVMGKLDSLLYFRLGLLRNDRKPLRISGLRLYRLIPGPVDQVMVHLNCHASLYGGQTFWEIRR
jgi:hypothetical protein